MPDWKACTKIFSSSDLFCLEIWGGVRGLNATEETLASCTRCSTVPVSSCACLWISVMKQVTLLSSSFGEVASDREWGGKERGGQITSYVHTRILRHWARKEMLWSVDQPKRKAVLWFGWRAVDNSFHRALRVWKMDWKMKDFFFFFFSRLMQMKHCVLVCGGQSGGLQSLCYWGPAMLHNC